MVAAAPAEVAGAGGRAKGSGIPERSLAVDTEIQTIMTPNGEELVILSRSDYEALLCAAEDADDYAAIDARRDEPMLPHDDAMQRIAEALNVDLDDLAPPVRED